MDFDEGALGPFGPAPLGDSPAPGHDLVRAGGNLLIGFVLVAPEGIEV